MVENVIEKDFEIHNIKSRNKKEMLKAIDRLRKINYDLRDMLDFGLFNFYTLYMADIQTFGEVILFLDHKDNFYIWNKKFKLFEKYCINDEKYKFLKVFEYNNTVKIDIHNLKNLNELLGEINWVYTNINDFSHGVDIDKSLFLIKVRHTDCDGISLYLTKHNIENEKSSNLFYELHIIDTIEPIATNEYNKVTYNTRDFHTLSPYSTIIGYHILPNITLE